MDGSRSAFEPLIQKILLSSQTIYERYAEELSQGKLPSELDLKDIEDWSNAVSGAVGSKLRDRLLWLKDSLVLNKQANEWAVHLPEIFQAYTSSPKLNASDLGIPFSELLWPWIRFADSRLKLSSNFTVSARTDLLHHLLKELSRMASPSLMETFHMQRMKGSGYLAFVDQVYAQAYETLWEEYAVLCRILTETSIDFINGMLLLDQRISQDQELLFDLTSFKEIKVERLELGLTRAHTKDGQVAILCLENQVKLVYKPRSGELDVCLSELVHTVNSFPATLNLSAARTMDRGAYSWQEYIEYMPCPTEESVSDYYTRMGQWAALLYVLGSSDYHYGNIIANGDQPVLTDNETLFSPECRLRKSDSVLGDLNLESIAKDSHIQGHFLLDAARAMYPNSRSITGAFSYGDQLMSRKVVDPNSDTMRLEEVIVEIAGKNQAFFSGEKADPLTYTAQIQTGFRTMAEQLLLHKDQFIEVVKRASKEHTLELRLLVRPSGWYNKLLHKSLEPRFMRSGIMRSLLLEQASLFYLSSDHKEEARQLLESELMQLQDNLVPWFHIGMSDSSVIEGSAHSYVRRSAYQVMNDRWYRLENYWNELFNDLKHFTAFSEGTSMDQVMHKLAYLYDHWYKANSSEEYRNSAEAASLGTGNLGIALLFAAYNVCTNGNSMKDWIQTEAERAIDIVRIPDLNPGAINGLGSVILVLDLLEAYGAIDMNSEDWDALLFYDIPVDTAEPGFANGLAGYLFALNRRYKKHPNELLTTRISQLADALVEKFDQCSGSMSFSDGIGGMLYVLSGCQKQLSESAKQQYQDLSVLFLLQVGVGSNSQLSLSQGLAGELLVLRKMMTPASSGQAEHHYEELLNTVFQQYADDTWLNGLAGVVELFISYDDQEIIADKINTYFKEHGRFNLGASYLDPFFSKGISGILYHQLRLQNPSLVFPILD